MAAVAPVIDLRFTAGRFRIHLTWNRKAESAQPSAPVSTNYPMRVSAPFGFRRHTVRTEHEGVSS